MTSRRSSIVLAGLLASAGCNVIKSDLLGGGDGSDDAGTEQDDAPGKPGLPANITPNGLRVHYGFWEGQGTDVSDTTGHFNATASMANLWAPEGRHDGALHLGGGKPPTQYVSLPGGILTDMDDFTIAAWVKLSANPDWARVYEFGSSSKWMFLTTYGFLPAPYAVGMANGIHATSFGGSEANESWLGTGQLGTGSPVAGGTTTSLPIGVWKHVAVTGTGAQRTIYIDGFPTVSVSDYPVVPPRDMEPSLGQSWIGKGRFDDNGFAGDIDDFVVYDRVLAPDEIANLARPKNEYSYWRFDETGASSEDMSDLKLTALLANGAQRVQGRIKTAVQLAHTGAPDAYISIGGNPFGDCSDTFTVSMWIKLTAQVSGARILDFGTGTTHSLYVEPFSGTGIKVHMNAPSSSGGQNTFDLVTSSLALPADSSWHHFAIRRGTDTSLQVFVDGAQAPGGSKPAGPIKGADFKEVSDQYIGKSRAGGAGLEGVIDELRISCRAFTNDEMKFLAGVEAVPRDPQ
jgi:hypothetical protein